MADEKIRSGRAGKTAGRLLLLLSTVILIAAIVFSSYMGGQSKLMSKLTAYYKSGTIDKIGTLISDNADKDGLLRDIQNSWDMESAIYGDDLSVRYKFESACFVKSLCSRDKSYVAFVDEVNKAQALSLVLFSHRHYKSQISFHKSF